MGSFYQSKSYFKGGSRKRTGTKKGGFYPSVMSGVVGSGKYLFPLVVRQGYKLVSNKTRKRKSKTLRKKNK